MDKIKIEKNIKIPLIQKRGKWINILNQMVEGDSIILENKSAMTLFRSRANLMGIKAVTRTVKENGKSMYRGWVLSKQGIKK